MVIEITEICCWHHESVLASLQNKNNLFLLKNFSRHTRIKSDCWFEKFVCRHFLDTPVWVWPNIAAALHWWDFRCFTPLVVTEFEAVWFLCPFSMLLLLLEAGILSCRKSSSWVMPHADQLLFAQNHWMVYPSEHSPTVDLILWLFFMTKMSVFLQNRKMPESASAQRK